tara:strand:+ start:118 stop:255 length:138 start_codon:yes stop_codon:yes gene_type:complete
MCPRKDGWEWHTTTPGYGPGMSSGIDSIPSRSNFLLLKAIDDTDN